MFIITYIISIYSLVNFQLNFTASITIFTQQISAIFRHFKRMQVCTFCFGLWHLHQQTSASCVSSCRHKVPVKDKDVKMATPQLYIDQARCHTFNLLIYRSDLCSFMQHLHEAKYKSKNFLLQKCNSNPSLVRGSFTISFLALPSISSHFVTLSFPHCYFCVTN